MTIAEILSNELGQKLEYIENVIRLLDEGNTIPFIARYRKEMHGAMDDTTLRNLETRLTYLRSLQSRRDEVKKSIENQGKLTDSLSAAIDNAATLTEVEDLYRPYKQKRRTRGHGVLTDSPVQMEKDCPQPQVVLAFGLLITNREPSRPSW